MSTPGATQARESTALIAVAALALLWGVGLFGRGYWTPDEPREAALAASVSLQFDALPSLAGRHFAEKPPLSYWLAGASMRLFGAGPAAARVPQLLYALLAFGAVLALARRLLGQDPRARALAWAAALLFATSELVYQVQIWLDTDALLLVGVCMALAGMYAGLCAAGEWADAQRARSARWRGFLVMHAGLTLAFFGKNFAAWLVPVLAFLCFIAWERRWRELLRWELYAGALLPIACIVPWVLAVAAQPDGAQSLRVLFWNNLVGRALPVAAEAQFNYSSGHRNWAGRYFLELPLDLLPWTALALCALRAAWRGARIAGPQRAAWRFALCAALPALLVLSLAATARSIYAAPCMIGFALLMALWARGAISEAERGAEGRRALAVTALLLALLALAVLAGTVALQWTVARASWPVFVPSAAAAAAVVAWSVREGLVSVHGTRPQALPASLQRLAAAWSLLLSLGVLSLFGAMNRAQDLEAMAAGVAQAAGARPLVFWSADETTLGWAQLYLPAGRWSAIDAIEPGAPARLAQRLRAAPQSAVVSMIGGQRWSRAAWLEYLRGRATAAELSASGALDDPALAAAGLKRTARFARPGGRGYLLWQR
jgi:4-amino-4-deoxy-L-arabinose transferase-like glycosyltransferase